MADRIMFNRRDAATFLSVPEDMLRRWEREGRGPAVYRYGRNTARYALDDLQAFDKASRKSASAAAVQEEA
jgi:hypothetical protein